MKKLTAKGRAVLRAADESGEFRKVCLALGEIRSRRLYLDSFKDFNSYITSSWPQIVELAGMVGFSIDEVIDFGCQLQQVEN